MRSLFTDHRDFFPPAGERIWWEVWTRVGQREMFHNLCDALDIPLQPQTLTFPDRDVWLLYGNEITIARLFLNSSAIAELRRAKDTPAPFVEWSNTEQAGWAADLAERVSAQTNPPISVCLLDTEVTRLHPLLGLVLAENDEHVYDPAWTAGDVIGHGTNMAGTIIYGDLTPLLQSANPVSISYCLESVKVLPDEGENNPRLYGAITGEAVARAEVSAPQRKRVVCLALTSEFGTDNGRPSSWSSRIDQLSFGDETIKRLILISAGNIRNNLSAAEYPFRNETEPIENPAQAWNAITVGAYTEKDTIEDPAYAGWNIVAPVGDLCPTSRTSLTWGRQWPIKPDLVMEGGNWASDGEQCDCPDDLGILTTYRDPTIRHFETFRDTSAATAAAANLAAKIYAAMPERWPETIRALMVHSAEWTPVMRQQLDSSTSENQRIAVLRKFGYGVPDLDRAILSAANDLTLIAEDTLLPLYKEEGRIKSRDMNLHVFPWPRPELEQMGELEVELRVTLSYFVEPNPGERGWLRRHRYPSHGLRFEVKHALESVPEFRRRINKAAAAEEHAEIAIQATAEGDNWLLKRSRNSGSIHSDFWRGSAAELAQRSAIAVYPIGGWWKENPAHHRFDQRVRYALVVSIKAVNSNIDIYTPVRTQIATATAITT